MSNPLETYVNEFTAANPELQQVSELGSVPASSMVQLGDLIERQALYISRRPKEELTNAHTNFINKVFDLGTRTIVYAIEQNNLKLPNADNTEFIERATTLLRCADGIEGKSAETSVPIGTELTAPSLAQRLGGLTGGEHNLRTAPENRVYMEDYAMNVMPVLGQIAEANQGLPVDRYIHNNIANILAAYEQVEALH